MHKSTYLLILSISLLASPAMADSPVHRFIGGTTSINLGHRVDNRNEIVISTEINGFQNTFPRTPSHREIMLLEHMPRVVYHKQFERNYRAPTHIIYAPERRYERVVYIDRAEPNAGWQYATERACTCDGNDERPHRQIRSFYRYDSWDE